MVDIVTGPEQAEGQELGDYRRVITAPASSISTRMQRWFWDERIPVATVAAFAGRGGEGKSSFAFHIAAELTRGRLPGDYEGSGSDVLIWSGEDQWETIINPRLIASGADLDRVHKLGIESVIDGDGLEVTPNLPADLPLIRDAIEITGARLVIIDPISSTMHGDLNKEADTRRTLDGLARIAHHTGAVILVIRHFNKGAGNASDKMSGSHSFRDAARSVFLFATDSETEQRIVTQDKGNYSEHSGGSFAFTLESMQVRTDDGNIAPVARVVPLGDTDLTVSQIINRNPAGEDDSDDRSAAQAFILDYLSERGEAPAGEVLKAGKAAGFSDNELKNARKRSRSPRIDSRKSAFGGGWVWAIDPQGVTKVSKVSLSENTTPSTPWVTPSQNRTTCAACHNPMVDLGDGADVHPGCTGGGEQ